MPPDVEAPVPDSLDPTSIVNVVSVGMDFTMNFTSSKVVELKLELVIDEKLSHNIISPLLIPCADEKLTVTTEDPLVVVNALESVVVVLIGCIS